MSDWVVSNVGRVLYTFVNGKKFKTELYGKLLTRLSSLYIFYADKILT